MGNSILKVAGVAAAGAVAALSLRKPLIVDVNTGRVVEPGDTFTNVDGKVTVHEVEVGLFSGRALVSVDGRGRRLVNLEGEDVPDEHPVMIDRQWCPLIIRYTHPSYLFRKVAFIPS